jgi:DNA-binding CsgD family transcriptional regulator
VVCTACDGNALTAGSALVGRELELARVDLFLEGVASRSPHALLIEGEPGAGKTALWREGLSSARARGYRTLVARPVEIEAALSFAGLVDLFEPVLEDTLPRLPEPQRRALEIALLLRPADAVPDRRALATGVLNALRALATASAVIVAVDDVQWLDSSSGGVLAFAARRLGTESVSFLLSRRVDGEVVSSELETALADRIEHLCPSPLSVGALHRLLQTSFGRPFSRPVVRRLREISEGNPFFTLELARGLDGLGAVAGAAHQLHFPATLREVVHERLESLPPGERELLLGVAALSHPTLELLDKAAGPGVTESSLSRALETQVVELDGERVRFTHPLLGSVLYADAGAATRKELHRRLAEVVTDPEESARHLALAADGPDRRVAARLDEAAEIVAGRGAPDRAAELLTRAVELTPPGDPLARGRRLAAADCWTDAGDGARAVPLLEGAIAVSLPGDERAEALARLGWIRCRNAGFRDGSLLFEEAAREKTTEPGVRISIEKGLAWADQMLGDLAASEVHVRSAATLAEGMGQPALMAETLADLAFIEMLRGQPQFRATMSAALALEDSRELPGIRGRARWLDVRARWLEALVLAWTDQFDAARAVLIELRSQAWEHGHEHFLPYLLNWLGRIDCFAGNWSDGLVQARQAHDASVQGGLEVERPYSLATIGLAHAHLGDVDAARAAISAGLELAQRMEVVPAQFELLAVKGFLELSLGQPREAHTTLAGLAGLVRAAGFAQPAVQRFHPDLVEAAIEVGDLASARRHHGELEACAAALESPWACALSRRCKGLIAAAEGDLETALERLERALVEHERLPNAFERGRTLLHHGVMLRRLKRKRQARDSIETALGIFEQLGARLWVDGARRELARISGSSSSATNGLSETERRVAALVAAGHANKQVAAELHITVRTVESNLTRIYSKLGIRSRSQLAARFPRGH